MARERFHVTAVRDAILACLEKRSPCGHSPSFIFRYLLSNKVRCGRAGVYKALAALVDDGWITLPKMTAGSNADMFIDDLIEAHKRGAGHTGRVKSPYVGYHLTKRGLIAAHASLARQAFERDDHQALAAWLTQIQRDVSSTSSAELTSLERDHQLVVSKRDAARLNAHLAKPSAPNAALRAAAKRFQRDLDDGAIAIDDPAIAAQRGQSPRDRAACRSRLRVRSVQSAENTAKHLRRTARR